MRNDDASTVIAGVRDEHYRGGPSYDFDVSFVAPRFGGVAFANINEEPTHADTANAQQVSPPVAVAATLDGAGGNNIRPDVYAISLNAGDVVGLLTEPGTDNSMPDADTFMTVTDPGGDRIAFNLDYINNPESMSAIAFEAAATGTYFVQVEPASCSFFPNATTCDGNGDYVLKVFVE